LQPTMETGFHTYGLDLQPDFLTFYYDREIILQVPNYIPLNGLKENYYSRPMFVMVNLAYGGGGSSNDKTALDKGGPRDMLVQYVRVWQGKGGSVSQSNPKEGANTLSFNGGFQLSSGQGVSLKGASLNVTERGTLVVYNTNSSPNTVLWSSQITADCGFPPTMCRYTYQGDGNFEAYDVNAQPYWGTATYNKNASAITFSNTAPYLSIADQFGKKVWQSTPDNVNMVKVIRD